MRTTTVIISDTTGATLYTLQYDAWGQPFADGNALNSYRFNGKLLDPDFVAFNLNNRRYHYPARTYIPFRQAFLQLDPLLLGATPRRRGSGILAVSAGYSLAGARITVSADPTGLEIAPEFCLSEFRRAEQSMPDVIHFLNTNSNRARCSYKLLCECCSSDRDRKVREGTMWGDYRVAEGAGNGWEVVICTDRIPGEKERPGAMFELARHELVHALNVCLGAAGGGCEDQACNEIMAHSFSGACKDGGSIRGPYGTEKICVMEEAKRSLGDDCEGGIVTDALYEKCRYKGGALPKRWVMLPPEPPPAPAPAPVAAPVPTAGGLLLDIFKFWISGGGKH